MPNLNHLNRAIRSGDWNRALGMIEPGSWLDDKDADLGDTALCAAATAKAEVIVSALIRAGADVNARNRPGKAPLHLACQSGVEGIARALIDAGADVNAKTTSNPNSIDSGQTVLIRAVFGRSLPIIKLLIEQGADPCGTDDRDFSALHYAQFSGKRIADYLAKVIAAGAEQQEISIFEAVRARALERLHTLATLGAALDEREPGADMTARGGLTPLHLAAEGAWLAGTEFLLSQDVPADIRSDHQLTPLMVLGPGKEAVAVAGALIAAGADVNAQLATGYCPLLNANDVAVVRLLLAAGADPDLRSAVTGETVFLHACLYRGSQVLEAMMDGGADLAAVDTAGKGHEYYARSNHRARAVISARLGTPKTPADVLRAAMKALPERAKDAGFIAYAEKLGAGLNRKPAPWKKRKGAVYFHNVSLARVYAYLGETMPLSDDQSVHDVICARLTLDARAAGAVLFHLEHLADPARKPLVLLPIDEPLAPLLCCGTNANARGDATFVLEQMMAIAAQDPFDIFGCGFDFVNAQLRGPPAHAEALAERLIALCPDAADFSDIPGSVRALAERLASSGQFGLWWD